MMSFTDLVRWRRSFFLHGERTVGEIGLNKNGTELDIWLRVDGKPRWFSVNRRDLEEFLASDAPHYVIPAASNGNSEADMATDAAEARAAKAELL